MRNLKKHLRNKIGFTFITFLLFNACVEEQKSEKIVVKLNESVLTKKMLDSALTASSNSAKVKEEYINEWIETEVLYHEALKEDIQNNAEYINLVNNSKKKLAVSYYLKNLLTENEILPSDSEIEKYYNDFKEDFRLNDDLYTLNVMKTSSYDKAIQVRNKIIESNWDRTKNLLRSDSTIAFSKENHYKSDIAPAILLRVINNLIENETSIIVETEPSVFLVVSIEKKYVKDSIPPFGAVKENAKMRLIVLRQKDFIKERTKKLVEEHNLEIERYTE